MSRLSTTLAVALALAAPAAAFVAPVQPGVAAKSTALNAEMSKALPFLTKPVLLDGTLPGDAGFDPLGLSEIDDVGLDLYWMREAEIKHGRVAMLATVGFLFTEFCGPLPGWPLAEGRSQVDVFWDAVDEHPNAIVSATLFLGIVEIITGVAITKGRETGTRTPGDYGFNPLAFKITPEMSLKEIKNGRLAMWAAAGMIAQGTVTHEPLMANVAKTWS